MNVWCNIIHSNVFKINNCTLVKWNVSRIRAGKCVKRLQWHSIINSSMYLTQSWPWSTHPVYVLLQNGVQQFHQSQQSTTGLWNQRTDFAFPLWYVSHYIFALILFAKVFSIFDVFSFFFCFLDEKHKSWFCDGVLWVFWVFLGIFAKSEKQNNYCIATSKKRSNFCAITRVMIFLIKKINLTPFTHSPVCFILCFCYSYFFCFFFDFRIRVWCWCAIELLYCFFFVCVWVVGWWWFCLFYLVFVLICLVLFFVIILFCFVFSFDGGLLAIKILEVKCHLKI